VSAIGSLLYTKYVNANSHSNGVIIANCGKDLKPDNILLGEETDLALLKDDSARFAFPFVSELPFFLYYVAGFLRLDSLVYRCSYSCNLSTLSQ